MFTYHIQVQIHHPVLAQAVPSDLHSLSVQWLVNASCSLCSHH